MCEYIIMQSMADTHSIDIHQIENITPDEIVDSEEIPSISPQLIRQIGFYPDFDYIFNIIASYIPIN